jgi:hypothetical protein
MGNRGCQYCLNRMKMEMLLLNLSRVKIVIKINLVTISGSVYENDDHKMIFLKKIIGFRQMN